MGNNTYRMGKSLRSWKDGSAQTVTFIVTEDCNLRCKYCYITKKRSNKVMSFEIAKRAIDYILSDSINKQDAVIIEFIGGEPLLEIELIDKITDYFKVQAFLSDSLWKWNYRINICTNGINYQNEKIQKYIKKNLFKLSIGITLDGNKEKHDLQRVFPNGLGSYNSILPSIPIWLEKFYPSTKVTFASEDLMYLCDSIINLWNLNIVDVAANVVYENVWNDGDDKILESQLIKLADYVIENKLYNKVNCSFFDENIGFPYSEQDLDVTNCGAGKMLAIGPEGSFYPCIRYKDYSLNNKKEWMIGNVESGIDMEKVRPFMVATNKFQSDQECLECPIAKGCGFCQGFNYDEAKTETNFFRAKYICKMHKARVRANNYYFSMLFNRFGINREIIQSDNRTLYILLSDRYVSFCQYENNNRKNRKISIAALDNGIEYAFDNYLTPILVHDRLEFNYTHKKKYDKCIITHIIPYKFYEVSKEIKNSIYVFHHNDIIPHNTSLNNVILNVDSHQLIGFSKKVMSLLSIANRVNVNIQNLDKNFNFEQYYIELSLINKEYYSKYKNKQLNIVSDVKDLKNHRNCKAGNTTFTLAPNGKLYICPAYYSTNSDKFIGNMVSGVNNINDTRLYKDEMKPICIKCDAYQCQNCIFLNESVTNEVNVSPSYQCKKSMMEKNISLLYRNNIKENKKVNREEVILLDPIEEFFKQNQQTFGYYVYDKNKNESE